MLSGNHGKCNLIVADIEAASDTERAEWFLYRNTSNTCTCLVGGWIHTFTNTGVCVAAQKHADILYIHTHTHTHVHIGCHLLRNLLVSCVSFYFSSILSKQTKRFTPDMVYVPSLEEKVFDDSINQTAEQGWHCKTHIMQLPLQSKFNSKYSLTPRKQHCQIGQRLQPKAHKLIFYSHPVFPSNPRQALNYAVCFSAAPEWDIDFQEGSFHYSMPATLNLDNSIFSKSQKHSKKHVLESPWLRGRMIFISALMRYLVVRIQGGWWYRVSWGIIA